MSGKAIDFTRAICISNRTNGGYISHLNKAELQIVKALWGRKRSGFNSAVLQPRRHSEFLGDDVKNLAQIAPGLNQPDKGNEF